MKENTHTFSLPQLAIAVVATTVIAGGSGFWVGTKFQQTQAPTLANRLGTRQDDNSRMGNFGNGTGTGTNNPNPGNSNSANMGMMGNRPVTGSITSKDDNSITVEMADGSSKIILLSTNTTINKTAPATSSDLNTGEDVSIFGQENSDGSLTAQSIQLGAEFKANN